MNALLFPEAGGTALAVAAAMAASFSRARAASLRRVAFLLRCGALAAAWHIAVSRFPFEFGSMQSRNGSSGVGRCRVELSTIFLGMSMVETPAGFYTTIYKLQAQS
jgi:hypothetical protein